MKVRQSQRYPTVRKKKVRIMTLTTTGKIRLTGIKKDTPTDMTWKAVPPQRRE